MKKIEEKKASYKNGFLAAFLIFLFLLVIIYMFVKGVRTLDEARHYFSYFGLFLTISAVLLFIVNNLLWSGLCVIQPNTVGVITFFGRYVGVIREEGFWYRLPLSICRKISVKVINFNCDKLKVNDVVGNPIEIGAVVVYRVIDCAKAVFDVDDYLKFVEIQSETALRHVAAKYPYDNYHDSNAPSLRESADAIANELKVELQDRLSVAGVEVIEARLTHLAYAMEIASAMLQRQQASAILAARQIVVEGAVGMAKLAIQSLEKDKIVDLDDERKMMMINNLMVAIVSEKSAQPIINTSSLY